MIFAYRYVPSRLEQFQAYIADTVLRVWCQPTGPFDVTMLDPGFQPLAAAVPGLLLDRIGELYEISRLHLSAAQRDQLRDGFIANNRIEELCAGTVQPLRYADIAHFPEQFAEKLKTFFAGLYTDVLNRAPVKTACGSVLEHFQEFVGTNKRGKCAFCGIDDLKGEYQAAGGRRDAYDHYLPKDKYPFSSVNLHNLAPACYNCNSSYKSTLDPIFEQRKGRKDRRRKAFYPFSTTEPDVEFRADLAKADTETLGPADVTVTLTSTTHADELIAWDDVYRINLRYRDKLCKSAETKAWLSMLLDPYWDLRQSYPEVTFSMLYQSHLNALKANRLQDGNFLKIAFLEGCDRAGAFAGVKSEP
jgi:5-methylcytosine-specific restriction endonuclease McrA